MEVRIIKTCHGVETVRFLDGALLPSDVDLSSVQSVELTEYLTVQEWRRRFVPITSGRGFRISLQFIPHLPTD